MKNIFTQRPSHKLDNRRLCPFKAIVKFPLNVYHLKLPKTMRNHPVFHLTELNRAATDLYPRQVVPPPPPIVIDGEEEFVVEQILDSRLWGRGRKLKYLVKWLGYAEPDWRDARDMNRLEAVDRFHQHYPRKPGPLPEDD